MSGHGPRSCRPHSAHPALLPPVLQQAPRYAQSELLKAPAALVDSHQRGRDPVRQLGCQRGCGRRLLHVLDEELWGGRLRGGGAGSAGEWW